MHNDREIPDVARQRIAVIGMGIAGMSAAWLLAKRHVVTVFETAPHFGGHSNTVDIDARATGGHTGRPLAVDTGFIVYNEPCYPNLTALFAHLGVETVASDMSLSVSLDDGALEYGGANLSTLFAQRHNMVSPRFWSMLRDLTRFYREAPRYLGRFGDITLGAWLQRQRYGDAFVHDHLIPMAASIWSTPAADILSYPAEAFVRFCDNHGLLRLARRPPWRTVVGGSRSYVRKLTSGFGTDIAVRPAALKILRRGSGSAAIAIESAGGRYDEFDAVVVATHANDALDLLADPTASERALLGAFRYTRNAAVLHGDAALMPRSRHVWSSWNYVGRRPGGAGGDRAVCLTYWMNRLQSLDTATPLFVTLNPEKEPAPDTVHYRTEYTHPRFDMAALNAQRQLWTLQGARRTWYCGAYFGAGFHEDGLQAGLAVAEQLGGVKRPWHLEHPSSRIHVQALPWDRGTSGSGQQPEQQGMPA